MKNYVFISIFLFLIPPRVWTQTTHTVHIQGQASAWANINPGNELPLNLGVRYLPQLNYAPATAGKPLFDMELSAHLNGNSGLSFFDSLESQAQIKPYRAWMRFATNQLEFRAGLQKINFGSASLLRPLMWFDQVDPRDPLQLTDGVWGVLTRYYFLNNANVWVWGLFGNEGPKTWEIGTTSEKTPEFGGRIQLPIPGGEAALSYHHRKSDFIFESGLLSGQNMAIQNKYANIYQDSISSSLSSVFPALTLEKIPENRLGFDGRWDWKIGFWVEGTWIGKHKFLNRSLHQHFLSIGADYTLGLGNGLYLVMEQLMMGLGSNFMQFDQKAQFTALSASYPLSLFDNISTIVYRDWTNCKQYHFINYQRKFKRFSIYLMAFINPDLVQLPQQSESAALFSGKGLQFMWVFNH